MINVYWSSCNVLYSYSILIKLEFYGQIFENSTISNFKKIGPVRTELLHADGQMDRHDEANVAFRNFVHARKKVKFALQPDMLARRGRGGRG